MEATQEAAKSSRLTREQMFRNEKVFLRYIPNFSNGITDKTHPEYGGLSNNAKIGICAPILTNRLNDVFSDDELAILAKELNEPSLINKTSDFWKEFVTDKHGMSNSIFPIVIKKEGALYNKKNPIDYIYIKILKDSDLIGSSVKNAKEIGAKFALIEEKDQFKKEKEDIGAAKKASNLASNCKNFSCPIPEAKYLAAPSMSFTSPSRAIPSPFSI